MNDKLLQQIKTGYEHDDFAMQIIHHLHDLVAKGSRVTKQASNFEFKDGYLLWKGTDSTRLYIPDNETLRIDMIEQFHVPAHFGTDKTYAKLARHVYWSGMYDDTDKFCSACHDCQVNKVPNTRPQGKLQPHEIPTKVWDVITMDFLTELPRCSAGFDSVFVIVEKLSKRAIFIPTTKGVTAAGAAQLLQDAAFSKHGITVKMISDRAKFKSNFWKSLAQLLNIKLNISTSDHPQTDVQSEVMIKTLSNMIRKTIQEEKENWQTVLSTMEFEYNSSKNASTGLTPFEVDLGRIPHNPVTRKLEACGVKYQSAADLVEKRNAFRALARDNLAEAQARQRHYANLKRKDVKFEEDWFVAQRAFECLQQSRPSREVEIKVHWSAENNCSNGNCDLPRRASTFYEKGSQRLSRFETTSVQAAIWTQGATVSSYRRRWHCRAGSVCESGQEERTTPHILLSTVHGRTGFGSSLDDES